jgi:AcrR family transcriptional regulator
MIDSGPHLHGDAPAGATYDRILDVAEALLSVQGVQGTSIRQITEQASVNVAAVNYHFGTKDKLVEAVIYRRFEALEKARANQLDEIERRCRDENRAPRARELATVLISPMFTFVRAREQGWINFMRFLARLTWEPGAEKFAPPPTSLGIFERFDTLLRQAVPALAEDAPRRSWRLAFVRAAAQQAMMILAMLGEGKVPNAIAFVEGLRGLKPDDIEQELLDFVAAGLAA